MKNFLLTGGAGFVGSHLLEKLLYNYPDNEYVVIDNLVRTNGLRNIQHILDKHKNVTFINADVGTCDIDEIIYKHFAVGVGVQDYLFHLAATRINRCDKYNREGHISIADSGFNVINSFVKNTDNPIIFFASSASVYAPPKKFPMKEEDQCYPHTIYGAGKLYTENLIQSYKIHHPYMKYSICRFFSVYGERMDNDGPYTEVIFNWLDGIKKGHNTITVYGNPDEKILDLVHVDDVVDAILRTTDHNDIEDGVYNVSTGKGVTLTELISIIEEVTGVKLKREIYEETRSDIELKRIGDISKLTELGWEQKVDLKKGIERVWRWIQND